MWIKRPIIIRENAALHALGELTVIISIKQHTVKKSSVSNSSLINTASSQLDLLK